MGVPLYRWMACDGKSYWLLVNFLNLERYNLTMTSLKGPEHSLQNAHIPKDLDTNVW